MAGERFLVTGGTGCIGSWVVRNLVRQSAQVVVLTMDDQFQRLKLIQADEEFAEVKFVHGDITNLDLLIKIAQDHQINKVIHLAGLQLPFCKANPSLGAMVNVVGTINIFEMAKHTSIDRVVYASSAAVYGPKTYYPETVLPHNAPFYPTSHYGVYKIANEQNAKVYWQDNAISSIGLRPHTVYGAGRDQGMTSKPTVAMIAAAVGRKYHINFGGRYQFQYGDDVANVFINAARVPFEGTAVFSVGGSARKVVEIIRAIETVEALSIGTITFDDKPLSLPEEFDNQAMCEVLGEYRETALLEGVHQTIEFYRRAIKKGLVDESYLAKVLG